MGSADVGINPSPAAVGAVARTGTGPAPLCSVVIVDYNAGPLVTACVRALEAQTWPNVEVLVVDNASHDGSSEACQRELPPSPRRRYLRARRNLGFAGGSNLGIRESRGDVVLLLNPDTEAAPDLVAVMVERLTAEPALGALGAKIYDPGWQVLQHAGGMMRDNALTDHLGRGEEDRGQHDQERDCPYVTGAALAIRRDVLGRVGLLDPWYRPAYFEEADLCARVLRAGYRVVYEPRARLVHHEGTASGKGSGRFFYMYHRNRLRFVLRNYPFLALFSRFLPAELAWMRRWLPPEQRGPLARAYATNALRLPLTLLGY